MVAPSVLPGRAFQRADRVSRLLFHWTGRDLSLQARTGQVGTFARPSPGWSLDSLGIVRPAVHSQPRFQAVDLDGDGIPDATGLLLENARTNGWATFTEDYSNAVWSKGGVTVSSNITEAPDGVGVSDKLVESALNEDHRVQRTIAGCTDNTRTSVWWLVKAAERTWCRLLTLDKAGVFRHTWFNLGTGAIGTKNAGHDAWVAPLGLGYYFVGVSFDASTGATPPAAGLYLATTDGIGAYAGDGASGLYVWESAVEVDKPFPSFPGSILPNGLARSAEAATYAMALVPDNDLTILSRVALPLWATSSVDIGFAPGVFGVGDTAPGAGQGELRGGGVQASRNWFSYIDTPTTDSNVSAAIAAGREQITNRQFKNLLSGGQAGVDVLGTGQSFATAATPFAAFNGTTLHMGRYAVGQELCSVLLELKVAAGLYTTAQMLQLT